MPTQAFVDQVLERWLQLTKTELAEASTVRRSPDTQKAVIEIKTPFHLALIEIWEHSRCLDTTVHGADEDRGAILSAGPCDSNSEMSSRLEALRALLASRISSSGIK
jgi:hypothetical protein